VIEYSSGGKPAALVAALRYGISTDAAIVFSGLQSWAQSSCGTSSWMNVGARGVIHCRLRDGYDLLLWKNDWILDIEAADLGDVPGEETAGQIKEALLAHWLRLDDASVARTVGMATAP
jgi:hypothetical protein